MRRRWCCHSVTIWWKAWYYMRLSVCAVRALSPKWFDREPVARWMWRHAGNKIRSSSSSFHFVRVVYTSARLTAQAQAKSHGICKSCRLMQSSCRNESNSLSVFFLSFLTWRPLWLDAPLGWLVARLTNSTNAVVSIFSKSTRLFYFILISKSISHWSWHRTWRQE